MWRQALFFITFFIPINVPYILAAPESSYNETNLQNNHTIVRNYFKKWQIGVQGAGFGGAQPRPGVEKGPCLIRSSGFIEILAEFGHDIKDYGDIEFATQVQTSETDIMQRIHNVEGVANATDKVINSTSKIIQDGRFPLTLGGDHSISIGTISTVAKSLCKENFSNVPSYPIHIPERDPCRPLSVLWIDAHADINTPLTTPSGNMHGMPLAFLIKEMFSEVKDVNGFSDKEAKISANNVGYIGLRSVDPGEKITLQKLGIASFNMRDIDRFGIIEVTRRVLAKIAPTKDRPLFISLDIDSMDDLEISKNTGTPVPGGISLREMLTMLQEIQSCTNVVGMDITEVNPDLGNPNGNERTAQITQYIISCIFGECKGGM